MHPGDTGQVGEWLVWSALAARSDGRLHVFLPTRDMGIDGVVRHPASDTHVPVQVKVRTELEDRVLRIHVQEAEVTDPNAVVVAAYMDLASLTLHDPVLVMTGDQLRERATLQKIGPRRAYAIEVPWPPGERTRWHSVCVPLAGVPAAVVPALREDVSLPVAAIPEAEIESAVTGYAGEVELLRCAAASARLNAFHAFPDDEFVEYLLRHTETGGIVGVQVKCIEVSAERPSGLAKIPTHAFRPSPRAWLVAFARTHDGGFVDECLLIPSTRLEEVCSKEADAWHLAWTPGGGGGRLAEFCVHPAVLGARLEETARIV
jgi:hypothetical protein